MPICESTPNSTCAYRIFRVQSLRVKPGPWVSCALPSGCAKGESSVLGGRLPLDCVVKKSVIDTKLCSFFFPLRFKYAIHSSLEPNRLPGSDCLACRLTGFAAMSGLGAYSFVEAYRMGTLRRSPLPAGVKARPVWGATLVVFGLGCLGAGVIRLGM